MGRYTEQGTHLSELLGVQGTTDPADCTYCERACSKGFERCPTCEWDFGSDPHHPSFPKKNPGVVME